MKTVMREKQWAEKYPDLGTDPAPVEPSISEDYFELERERVDRRLACSTDEISAFYDTMISRIEDVLDHLDKRWGEDMPAPEWRLYLLTLSLVEISTLVELYGRRESGQACDPRRFVQQRCPQSSSSGRAAR